MLAEQAIEFNVETVAVANDSVAEQLQQEIQQVAQRLGVKKLPFISSGADAASELASQACDVVLNGITGSAGLMPTVNALKAGTRLALANKESLVIGGRTVTSFAQEGQIVPVDSEHSALAQCLRSGRSSEVRKLILTASGGPFRNATEDDLREVTPQQALNHPTWSMGPVVTINSSTMFNKGLEIIEAHLLFGISFDRIEVVVHPQSLVHSMVEFVDGSTIAQVSPPDMHLPIALGMGWPDRVANSTSPVDWSTASTWNFEPVNHELFPAVQLAKEVGELAGTAPAVMNAANEVAVEAFLNEQIRYLDIIPVVHHVVTAHRSSGYVSDDQLTIEAVIAADNEGRALATEYIQQRFTQGG